MCKADWIFLIWGCLKTKGQKHIHPIWIAFVARRICDEIYQVVVITTMHLNEHFVLGHPYWSSWDINWTIWNPPGRRDFNHCWIRNKKRCHVTQFCLLQTAHSSGLFFCPVVDRTAVQRHVNAIAQSQREVQKALSCPGSRPKETSLPLQIRFRIYQDVKAARTVPKPLGLYYSICFRLPQAQVRHRLPLSFSSWASTHFAAPWQQPAGCELCKEHQTVESFWPLDLGWSDSVRTQ